jgi:outer membrane protein OmpA-like peptidoglycan-associated protein
MLLPAQQCERDPGAVECEWADASSSRVSLSTAAYQLGSAEVPDVLARPLRAIGEAVRDQRAIVRIEVHTDASASPESSRALSQRRADAIRAQLIDLGVDPYRVQAVGLGSSHPKHPQDPLHTGNRRIDIVRL